MTGGIYRAPKLFLGNTPLWTSDTVWTGDLGFTNAAGQQTMGILGMDCLRHYAIQLDFAAPRMRFLDLGHVAKEGLGRPFPLTVYPAGASGYVTVHQSFTGKKGRNPILDTGCLVDGVLEPDEFQLAVREQKATSTNEFRDRKPSEPQIPLIEIENVPLSVAIENLAVQAEINSTVDPKIADKAWIPIELSDASMPFKEQMSVSVRFRNLTAGQALAAVCYVLQPPF